MRPIDADSLKINFEEALETLASYGINTITKKMVISIIDHVPTLKSESEPESIVPINIEAFGTDTWSCGYCNNLVGTRFFKNVYCSYCGKKVKWKNETN